MNKLRGLSLSRQNGFGLVEFVMASFLFTIIVIGLTNAYTSIRKSYSISRQYNEIYTVLSACPEIDRALEFSSLGSSTNCYPNNSFKVEDGGTSTITYAPTLAVSDTSALPSSDPLKAIPDSKVVNITVGFPTSPNVPKVQIRMLITRNGIGQQ